MNEKLKNSLLKLGVKPELLENSESESFENDLYDSVNSNILNVYKNSEEYKKTLLELEGKSKRLVLSESEKAIMKAFGLSKDKVKDKDFNGILEEAINASKELVSKDTKELTELINNLKSDITTLTAQKDEAVNKLQDFETNVIPGIYKKIETETKQKEALNTFVNGYEFIIPKADVLTLLNAKASTKGLKVELVGDNLELLQSDGSKVLSEDKRSIVDLKAFTETEFRDLFKRSNAVEPNQQNQFNANVNVSDKDKKIAQIKALRIPEQSKAELIAQLG